MRKSLKENIGTLWLVGLCWLFVDQMDGLSIIERILHPNLKYTRKIRVSPQGGYATYYFTSWEWFLHRVDTHIYVCSHMLTVMHTQTYTHAPTWTLRYICPPTCTHSYTHAPVWALQCISRDAGWLLGSGSDEWRSCCLSESKEIKINWRQMQSKNYEIRSVPTPISQSDRLIQT